MSQSPLAEASENEIVRYRQGWQALSRLMHEDKSFSGHERHCAFLNCGGNGFADVSSVLGIDYPEDGRAVAVSDLDFDGDPDLCLTNRTGPRLRLFSNDWKTNNQTVTVCLVGNGTTSNRDAIGARIRLHTSEGSPQSVRSVRAGDGFLAQSSAWISIGLGNVEVGRKHSVSVRWPDKTTETFTGLGTGGFFFLAQGRGEAVEWTPPTQKVPAATEIAPISPDAGIARIVLPGTLSLPRLEVGEDLLPLDRPFLLNIWASWCQPCLGELAAWTKAKDRIQAAGLDIVALYTDGIDQGSPEKAEEMLDAMGFPFRRGQATVETVRRLDVLQRAVLDRWQDLPVPSSFLVDVSGRVVVIYKGPVDTGQLLADLRLCGESPATRRAAATPFSGRWSNDPPGPDTMRVVTQFVDQNQVTEAVEFLQAHVESLRKSSGVSAETGDAYYVLSVLLGESGRPEAAEQALVRAREISPDDFRVHFDLGKIYGSQRQAQKAGEALRAALRIRPGHPEAQRLLALTLLQQGRDQEAIPLLRKVIDSHPEDSVSRFHFANLLRKNGDFTGAIEQYRRAFEANGRMLPAANNLAWILATHPDQKLRNGVEALAFAEKLCAVSKRGQPEYLDTLAAAQAETGHFKKAVATLEEAIKLSSGPAVNDLRKRRELYRSKKPFRQLEWVK